MIDYKEKYLKYKFKYLKNKEKQTILLNNTNNTNNTNNSNNSNNSNNTKNIKGGGELTSILSISIIVILAGLIYYNYSKNDLKYNKYLEKYNKYLHFCNKYDCGTEQIKKCFRKNALIYHPDRNPPEKKTESEENMKNLNNKYEELLQYYPPTEECNIDINNNNELENNEEADEVEDEEDEEEEADEVEYEVEEADEVEDEEDEKEDKEAEEKKIIVH